MFKKLASLLGKELSTHPLGSPENLERLLEEIPQTEPKRVLQDVSHWIEDIQRLDAEVSPLALRHAIIRIDEFSRPAFLLLATNYLAAKQKEYLSEAVWSQMERHTHHLFAAYRHCLQAAAANAELGKEKMQLALCASRALRAWAEQKKLQSFRYRRPEAESWSAAHALLELCAQLGIAALTQKIYGDEEDASSPIQNYLAGVYFEMAPIGNLVPLQLEIISRWLQQQLAALEFANVRNAGSSHYIDITSSSGPQRIQAETAGAAGRYFCSLTRLRTRITQFAAILRKEKDLPEWIAALEPKQKQLRGLPAALMDNWSDTPRKRSADRQQENADIKVVHGFSLALRMIAASQFAQKGLSVNYGGADRDRIYNLSRFGSVDTLDAEGNNAPEPTETADPMETLLKMETAGDIQMMESWKQVDVSETGMGAIAPGLRARHQIGELIGFREHGEILWRLAILRRIGRDSKKRLYMGMEFLPAPSMPARITLLADGPKSGWSTTFYGSSGQQYVILPRLDSNELILPRGLFKTGLELLLRAERDKSRIRLGEILDQGEDWERVSFTRSE